MGRSPSSPSSICVLSGACACHGLAALQTLVDHDYRVLRVGTEKTGRVLLRGKVATLSYFGLDALPPLESCYERLGGLQIGKLRTSPRKVCWHSFRIAVPEAYPSCNRWKGWTFSLSANHRIYDFRAIAQVIEAKGVPWTGFQKASGAKLFEKECLLAQQPGVPVP